MRRRTRPLALLACGCLFAGLAVLDGRSSAPAAAESFVGAGETVLVSPASPAPTDDPSGYGVVTRSPVLSGDGLTAAYGAGSGYYEGDSIWVRDLTSDQVTLLGDADQDQTAPSLTADGDQVAYLAEDDAYGTGARDVYVADLSADEPVTSRVTGLGEATGDLPFQRQMPCRPASSGDYESPRRCGPRISADGTALVIPARQSIGSPQLTASTEEPGMPYVTVDVVDFGTGGAQRVVTLTANGLQPITIDDVTVVPGRGEPVPEFTVVPEDSDCLDAEEDVVLDPEDAETHSCEVVVEFEPPTGSCSGDRFFGRLQVASPTTGGQIELLLVGLSDTSCLGLVAAAVEDGGCPRPMPVVSTDAFPADEPDDTTTVDRDLYETELGADRVLAQRIVNENPEGPHERIRFQTADCDIRLVLPEEEDAESPPCRTDESIPPGEDCIAYVRFTPGAVRAYGAVLSTSLESDQIRFSGAGTRSLLLVKRDPTATGAFTTAGEIADVDERGEEVTGSRPAISADGRHVAFTAPNLDAAGEVVGSRILLRDTVAGSTTVASAEVPLTRFVDEAALSGDGARVAYTTWERSRLIQSDVQVRDLAVGRTVTVSDPPATDPPATDPHGTAAFSDVSEDPPSGGRSVSRTPALSLDGSTVAFVSSSPELAPEGTEPSQQVFARDLGPDFGGPGLPGTELVSPPFDAESDPGSADVPALDGTGASIAFLSDGELTEETPPFRSAVYARQRFGSTVVAPSSLLFADQAVGTVGPAQTVMVRNDGPGPSTVEVAVDGPFELTDDCVDVVLHRGEACSFGVASAPTTEGTQLGTATVTTGNPVWRGAVRQVDLVGAASAAPELARLAVEPSSLAYAAQVVGTESDPVTVTVTNLGTRPMTVTAAFGEGASDYVIDPEVAAACVDVAPAASCALPVTFKPSLLGERPGRLDVSGTFGTEVVSQQVPVAGAAAEPTLEFSPEVVLEGRVTFLTGENFRPGETAELEWSAGLTPVSGIVPDEDGGFRVALVVLTGAPLGERVLTVRMPGVGDVESEPLLVVSRSAQPPGFTR